MLKKVNNKLLMIVVIVWNCMSPSLQNKATEQNTTTKTEEKPIVFVQIGHTDSVSSVAFSPDGKYVVSGSGDKTLKL